MSLSHTILAMGAAATVIFVGAHGPAPDIDGPTPVMTAADPPVTETGYVLGDEIEAYESAIMSGGPPKDGIPAIDEPEFVDADEADLDAGDRVIGFVHNGEARAYPHAILVHHEIVNDRVGGLNVSITYCPLTATAQGFERGSTTLGVSGRLLNSNMVPYDRETDSFYAQINAVGLTGPNRGKSLVERDVVWTTWERWESAHPDTQVLSTDTGYLRNYANDPYGSYNPISGYYGQNETMFPLMHDSDRHDAKEMVVGARTEDRSAYFVLEELAGEGIQRTDSFMAIYDADLHTGHVYLVSDGVDVTARDDGRYELDGATYRASELPLEKPISLEAFYFAWNAFFPDSESV